MKRQKTYFNPRSREGSDGVIVRAGSGVTISIHAPAKGATALHIRAGAFDAISIHAPAKGATEFTQWQTGESVISIHAPAKGATYSISRIILSTQFQSTLPRRERHLHSPCQKPETTFQSTLPRRERQHLLTSFRLQYGYSLFHLTNKI